MTLVWIEHIDGEPVTESLEALTLARDAAGTDDIDAALVGSTGAGAAAALAAYGVQRLHVLDHELCDEYAPQAWAEALVQLMTAVEPAALVAAGTARGNEVMAHVAARADLPLATACTAWQTGADWLVTRLRWGGVLLEDARLSAPVKLVTVAPHAVAPVPALQPGAAAVATVTPALDAELGHTMVTERASRGAGVSLTTAPVVVSGGRGVGSAEGFAALEALAELVGGAVGCSRVATSNGWRPHADQVGQTGSVVAPELYIACGISGATQHWVGCKNAKRILAINTDAEAPMVTRADYAVIGDLHEVLNAVVAELRARSAAVPAAAG